MKKWQKITVVSLAALLGACIYVSVGWIYNEWLHYANYYPKSTAAKVLTPTAPCVFSPFDEGPSVDKALEAQYGSYERFRREAQGSFWTVVLWPLVMVAIYMYCFATWVVHVLLWAFTGGPVAFLLP